MLSEIRKNYIKEENFEIWIEDNIVRYRYYKGIIIDLETAKKIVETRLKITEGITRKCLVDAREGMYMLNNAKEYLATKYSFTYVEAAALLVDSHVQQIIVNTYIYLSRSSQVPTKVFTKEKSALQWLKQLKTE
ncbi:MAG TPA: hypothetical protein VD908_17110 [Cytophagales bacterium]|nr:hypothetical protein [Cytophagales bacterium]